MDETCDVIVLGMGTSGEDAALRLAGAGVDVIGVEARLIGGECPFWACIPSKSLIRSANLLAEARRADGLVGRVTVEPDWSIVAERLRAEVTGGWDDTAGVGRFEAKGGRFVRGWGTITGPRQVAVDGVTYHARRGILLATGSSPFIPPVPGLADVEPWTNHEAIEVEDLPGSLLVLGGGPVGLELGQVFARFGVDVTIVEGEARVLPREEPEASEAVTAALADDAIEVRTGVRVARVSSGAGGITAHLEDGTAITSEQVLVATGRRADAGAVGAEAAGATVTNGFIQTDGRLRAADGLWAIGDVTGEGLLTQVAMYQGSIAVQDVLGRDPSPADYSAMPRATFTDPEVGSVGLTEAEAREHGDTSVVVKDLGATFRGWLHRIGNGGVVKLVAGDGRLLGATTVGPRATDVLGMLALAVKARTPLEDLVDMVYAFPTFYGGVGEAIGAYGRGVARVLDPPTAPLFDD